MQYIKSNYDVTSEGALRKQVARANLKKISYKNETTFKLDKYATKIKVVFNMFDKYGVTLYEE